MTLQLDLIDFVKKMAKPDEAEPASSLKAESPEPDATSGIGFEADVGRAVYSATIMRPIYELESRRFHQGEAEDISSIWDGVDLIWIAFAVLDAIAELTEYQDGVTRSELLPKISPAVRCQLSAGGRAFTDEKIKDVVEKVFDHLANRGNRYLAFNYRVFDGASGNFRRRSFWLIKYVYTGESGESLFRLTDEGYTAYFGLHETSALDATAIGNLRIKLLIERGNVDDAISMTEASRKQCIRKAAEVRKYRRRIRRNIRGVDYKDIAGLADEGANQASGIQEESHRLHTFVIENLLPSRTEKKYEAKFNRLAEQLERLYRQLIKLSGELQELPEDYRKHSHKLFRKRFRGRFPSMDQVMGRIFPMAETDAAEIGEEFIARIDPPARRPLFDPAAVIDACDRVLERRNPPGDSQQAVLEVDGGPVRRFISELDDAVMERAFEMIHSGIRREGGIYLSNLLRDAALKKEERLPVAVAMAVFHCTAEERRGARHGIRVELLDTEKRIKVALSAKSQYRGHELFLTYRSSSER